jgi:hypothetical protein
MDDDCNDVVDDGCPTGISWSDQVEKDAIGDGFGGSYFGVSCAEGEILVGLRVKAGSFFDGLGALCSHVAVEPTGDAIPYEYGLRLEEPSFRSGHNDSESTMDLICDEGTALIGVRGALQNYNNGSTDFVVFTRLWARCAAISLAEDGSIAIDEAAAYEEGPVSGSYANNMAWFDEFIAQRVSTGIHGMAGSWIDRIGLKTAISTLN